MSHTYTPAEVFRTAFERLPPRAYGISDGAGDGINAVCICCKAGASNKSDVSQILDKADLKPWSDFYLTRRFKAYRCGACGYAWSVYE